MRRKRTEPGHCLRRRPRNSEGPLNFLLVAGWPWITIIRPGSAAPAARRVRVVFVCVLPRQQAFGGPETVYRNQVPQMKICAASLSGRARWMAWPWSEMQPHDRAPSRGATFDRVGCEHALSPGNTDAHPTSAVDIRAAAGEIPSPQTAKSASVFTGLCLMDLTSIEMVRAPVGTGGADHDGAVAVGSRNGAGQS